jgi:acetylglutamate kinase
MKAAKPELTLIKIGGNIIDDPIAWQQALTAFSQLKGTKILVHGGGKEASKIAKALNLETQMVDGRRITDQPMLDVVVMTYAGLINKRMVAQLNALDCPAFGFSGADGNLIQSEKRTVKDIDFGFVGDIRHINAPQLLSLLSTKAVPVFCAITHDGKGQLLNTNADTIAAELGIALSDTYSVKIIYCFEKQGVLINTNDESSLIPLLTASKYRDLLAIGGIHSGMIPKLDNCFSALTKGVDRVIIGNLSTLENPNTLCTVIQL